MRILWAALLLAAPFAPGADLPEGPIAIGDVHGDFVTFRALLRSAGLIDERDSWSGGTRRLIQTGDLLDRGPGSRLVLELLMRLEGEAARAGGAVIVVLGNHEVMNIVGDLYSTTIEEFAAFAAEEDPTEREKRREEILEFVRRGSPRLRSRYTGGLGRVLGESTFESHFPPGFFAHRAAFSPAGRYGKWLLEHDIVHREGRTLFLHGGLSQRFGTLPLDEINRAVKAAVAEYLKVVRDLEKLRAFHSALGFAELALLVEAERKAGGPHPDLADAFARLARLWESAAFHAEGPLWYRGLAEGSERLLWRSLDQVLRAQDADRIVIGHTQPRSLTVEGRFQSRVILIDTGMNQAVYGGKPSAVVLKPDGEVVVWEASLPPAAKLPGRAAR